MKISLFAGRISDQGIIQQTNCDIEEAARIASTNRSKLLVLPGWSMRFKDCHLDFYRDQASKYEIHIIAEVPENSKWSTECVLPKNGKLKKKSSKNPKKKGKKNWKTYLFYPDDRQPIQFYEQQFVSNPCAPQMGRLIAALPTPVNNGNGRQFQLVGRNISVLLCGEFGALQNHEGGPPTVQHNRNWPYDSYHILLNPAHRSINHYHQHFTPKCAFFSANNRVFLHCANCVGGVSRGRTIYHYKNGAQLHSGNNANPIYDNWRLLTVTV
ncbi:MAG: hypothetical protein NUW37_18590 [Planctomycetes bacterium]|nr:hypothetical protein [Planctomycetota bacterium]